MTPVKSDALLRLLIADPNGFLRRLLDLHLELVDTVEAELAADEGQAAR